MIEIKDAFIGDIEIEGDVYTGSVAEYEESGTSG